ncbi:MAG: hypothetical protein M0D55_11200 [Elusimicrobiota bacterium]|nr:MAG: hypothetical protein M0D55_11200 [Elusimicrobiota bacterium]
MAKARHPREEGGVIQAGGTIVALATPPGRSALGVVRLSGPDCRRIALALLGAELEPRRATTRALKRDGRVVDRVVATYWAGPATPTGEDLLELTAHGSPEILREIVEAALDAGARAAAPGEFTRRAFTNGRLDLAQARAVGDLISARGEAARAAALRRLEGAWPRRSTRSALPCSNCWPRSRSASIIRPRTSRRSTPPRPTPPCARPAPGPSASSRATLAAAAAAREPASACSAARTPGSPRC